MQLEGASASRSRPSRFDAMRAMASKYTTNFPEFLSSGASGSPDTGDVVLVTGTTGTLGCRLLVRLVSNPEIRCIYALNRSARDGETVRQRQENALRTRGLDASILDRGRVVLLEGNLMQPRFGLSAVIYEEVCVLTSILCDPKICSCQNQMHASVTHIIHNSLRSHYASTVDELTRAACSLAYRLCNST